MSTTWRYLADVVVGVHYSYVAYMIGGGFLAWRWRRTIWVHIVAVGWAVLIVTTKVPCPLTALQNNFRERAGQSPLGGSFVNTYLGGTFYPAGQQTLAQAAAGVVVLASWIGYRHLRRVHPRQAPARC
ncbi:MAG: DUF2784 domain-containing protein [Jatrophihabitantaceae bacterium]